MPLPYGWDHEAIAAKLRVLGAEGVRNPKERYAIAMDSARQNWRESNGSAPMPKNLRRKKGAKKADWSQRRNESAGRTTQGIPRGQLKRVIKELRVDGWRLAGQDESGRYATVLVDHPEFGRNHPIKVWATDAPPPSFQSTQARRNRASGRMRWWYVSSGFRYVLVRASNETDAAILSKPKFKALDGRAAEVINNVRPATDDELDLYKFHVKNVRKEASYTRKAKRGNRASGKSQDYVTTYCNRAHRMRDGSPIGHQCRRLPVAALKAERDGDYDKANDILARQSR